MSRSSSPDYKALFLQAEEWKQAEERQGQAEHPLRAEAPSCSTTCKIPPPTGKYCPIQLLPWTCCEARQQEIYKSVCCYLQPTEEDAKQLFTPLVVLENHGRQFARRPISSKQDLETFDRVWFDNHTNTLDEDDGIDASQSSTARPSRPDQFCIYQVNSNTSTLLTTIEYKLQYMLSLKKSRYNTAWLVRSAIVQEFHVMIQEGLEYSYLINSLMDMQLLVPSNNPCTLYYNLGNPSIYRTTSVGRPGTPITWIERTICLCLMSFRPSCCVAGLPQNPSMGYVSSDYTSTKQTTSEYLPLSSPAGSPSSNAVKPWCICWKKRGFSQVTLSSPTQQSGPRTDPQGTQSRRSRLLQGSMLDPDCPNMELHILGRSDDCHLISIKDLVKKLKAQLDQDLDHNCTLIGSCGSFGAPFKITCATFGYTIKEVSREAEVYHVLQRAQGSAVPIYFLHGAGEICHMLLMGWGGESMGHITLDKTIGLTARRIALLPVSKADLRALKDTLPEHLFHMLSTVIERQRHEVRPKGSKGMAVKESLLDSSKEQV
ncbi:hypothetical protein BDV10DRAFT_190611 [Aspergillus recurvatus]